MRPEIKVKYWQQRCSPHVRLLNFISSLEHLFLFVSFLFIRVKMNAKCLKNELVAVHELWDISNNLLERGDVYNGSAEQDVKGVWRTVAKLKLQSVCLQDNGLSFKSTEK